MRKQTQFSGAVNNTNFGTFSSAELTQDQLFSVKGGEDDIIVVEEIIVG